MQDLLTARQAADRLGIKLDTLYAYVSRGRIRSVTVPGSRERRYRPEDVEALLDPRSRDSLPRRPEGETLMPVIGSSICLIENGKFYYRGRDAVALSETAALEEVAALLWRGERGADPAAERVAETHSDKPARSGLIESCQIRLAALSDEDLPALDLTRPGVIRTGWRILDELVACIASSLPSRGPIHCRLAAAWGLDESGTDILRRCLVLIADHELNASTFVARCVASTGATPYAVVSGALAALSGRRHGGASAPAAALFFPITPRGDPMAGMGARRGRGRPPP